MTGISLSSTDQHFLLTIDKNMVTKAAIERLIARLRLEYLAEQANFDASIEEVGEEMKADWWAKNKARLLGNSNIIRCNR